MQSARHEEAYTSEQDKLRHPGGTDMPAYPGSTAAILSTLDQSVSPEAHLLLQSFILVEPVSTESWPSATVCETLLIHSKKVSDSMKATMGVKSSSHTVDVVSFNEGGCDVVVSPPCPHDFDLNQLPGKSTACYIFTTDKKLYYADKKLRLCSLVPVEPKNLADLCEFLKIDVSSHAEQGYKQLIELLDHEKLIGITSFTGHIHGMGFYKKNEPGSVMSSLESANSIAYQLLGPRHFPTCYTVRDEMSQYIGVFSKLLPGFKPNRDKPLQQQDLELSSLKCMIKKRDAEDLRQLDELFAVIREMLPLLKREVSGDSNYFYQVWEFARNTGNYYLGDESSAVHVKPKLEAFLKLNIPTITFGKLEELRGVLMKRKSAILLSKSSYVATQHQHDKEMILIDKAIEKLNQVLLDETALYLKHLHGISCTLQENWVDVAAEQTNPSSKYANIQIDDGMVASLHVSLEDVLHFRILCGQAIGLTSRYFMQDPDGHAKNLSSDGCNVDGDLAVYPLTYRFKSPGRKPLPKDFILDVNDYINFPNLTAANFRYWPTRATILDTSADTALSPVSDITKNYFTTQDNQNYQSLCDRPVFNFQKYVQLIILALTDKAMYTSCAMLHMPDDLHMLNDEGNTSAPLPLLNSSGEREDVRQKWIEFRTARALEARNLALQLAPLRKIMERHGDFILDLVLSHFRLFLRDRAYELNPKAMRILEEGIQMPAIARAFNALKTDILESTANLDMGAAVVGMRHTH
ncbi:hypothetical protein AQUSIP_08900 [Aquicella siphonis]|uniref:Uncharacterized protein n=1 Tax=Aquicella siphonis TaxID=254247 RepID=A0A5E4PF35_9COXI|nr:hypothetical protein [Aquicella siphonis]VVC75600.1 hypothetical protein AQUSIP_08900 [Aquicella siphonis]